MISWENIQNKKASIKEAFLNKMSRWQDLNLRPPAPKAGALTGLRYTSKRTNNHLIYNN